MEIVFRPSERSIELANLLGEWSPRLETEIDVAARTSGARLLELLKAETPARTGATRNAWRLDVAHLQIVVSNPTPSLFYVLHGNDYPHSGGGTGWIYPKFAQALSFTIDGQHFIRRRVKAAKANPFTDRVLVQWRPEARQLIQGAINSTAHWILRSS